MIERRQPQPFVIDEQKFSTQKKVTYILLLIFAAVTVRVMSQDDQSERSMVLQTVINLTLLAVGYWLGASKAAADQGDRIGKMAEAAAPAQAVAVAAARADVPDMPVAAAPIHADTMNVDAHDAKISINQVGQDESR